MTCPNSHLLDLFRWILAFHTEVVPGLGTKSTMLLSLENCSTNDNHNEFCSILPLIIAVIIPPENWREILTLTLQIIQLGESIHSLLNTKSKDNYTPNNNKYASMVYNQIDNQNVNPYFNHKGYDFKPTLISNIIQSVHFNQAFQSITLQSNILQLVRFNYLWNIMNIMIIIQLPSSQY